eukprot:840070-Pyramimonas_sp.AAC.1
MVQATFTQVYGDVPEVKAEKIATLPRVSPPIPHPDALTVIGPEEGNPNSPSCMQQLSLIHISEPTRPEPI